MLQLLKLFGVLLVLEITPFVEGNYLPITIVSSETQSIHPNAGGHNPEKAYDDDVSTIYAPKDGVSYSEENWVKFNLGKIYSIRKIVVINRIDCCMILLSNTEVNVVNTGISQTSLCGVIVVDRNLQTVEAQTYTFYCNLVGDQVMMTDRDVTAHATLSFAEIDVFYSPSTTSDEPQEINAITATQSKTKDSDEDNFSADKSFDNDLSTAAFSFGEEVWLNLALDKIYFIDEVVVFSQFFTAWFVEDACTTSVEHFKTCKEEQSGAIVMVYRGNNLRQKACGQLDLHDELTREEQTYRIECNWKGDNVKFYKAAGDLVIHEVAVIGWEMGRL